MRVFHGYRLHVEAVPPRQFNDLLGVVVGHQEVAPKRSRNFKKQFVVNLVVFIQPLPRLFPSCRVGWVNKKYRVCAMGVVTQKGYTVTFNKGCSRPNLVKIANSLFQRFGIPARRDAFATRCLYHFRRFSARRFRARVSRLD